MTTPESTSLAYERGRVTFMGVDLHVAPGALVPRQETELLGVSALAAIGACHTARPRVVDMCCGSGNLACALALQAPHGQYWASDLTDGCVAVTRRNVEQLGLSARVTVTQGDLFAGLRGLGLEGTIDVVVCNPPYISQAKLAAERAELLEHEPREAFDGGPYGLTIHQRMIREASAFLRPGGVMLFEVGLGQGPQLTQLATRARVYVDIQPVCNAAGEVRVVSMRTAGSTPDGTADVAPNRAPDQQQPPAGNGIR
jgi:release factor glutamine methyltransferase